MKSKTHRPQQTSNQRRFYLLMFLGSVLIEITQHRRNEYAFRKKKHVKSAYTNQSYKSLWPEGDGRNRQNILHTASERSS